MLKMTIDNEEVVSKNNFTIKEEMLSPSSTILNNTYPKTWENDKDYISRFYYPKDYAKLNIQNFSITPEEAGTTIQVNGSATLTDVDTTKESRVLSLKGNTSQNGTPTPSSPIDVNVVSGDNEINICGKNLLNEDEIVVGFLSVSGQWTPSVTSWSTTGYIPIQGETTYKFSFEPLTTGNYWQTRAVYYDKNMNYISGVDFNSYTSNYSFTITTPQDVSYMRLSFTNTGNYQRKNFMLEVGSTATTYEPYIGNTYPIYLGVENLVKGIFRQGAGTNPSATNRLFSDDNFYVEAGTTYTLSTNMNMSIFRYAIGISPTQWPNGSYSYDSGWKTTSTFTFTPSVSGYFGVGVSRQSDGSITPSDISSYTWQLEKGSKANSYSAYGTTPIELCKIGTYQDYIYKDNGSWYLHKEIGKVVLDGSENISSYVATSLSGSYQATFEITTKSNSTDKIVLSDYFDSALLSDRTTKTNICYTYTDGLLRIATNVATTMANFKTWLSTNKPSVYYVLANSTNTLITDTTLISQLDALESQ